MQLEIRKGQKFNMLTAIKEAPRKRLPCGQINRVILCKCDCGNKKEVRLVHLVRGRIKSCGCLTPLHGMTGSKLHNTWRAMKYRCKDSYFQSQYYSKKGISLHKLWETFIPFKNWALKNGYKSGLQIDRINSNKGYYPGNCRWATCIENANNKYTNLVVNYKGDSYPLGLLLRDKGLINHYAAIRCRIKRGWNIEDAIDVPIRKGNYRTLRLRG